MSVVIGIQTDRYVIIASDSQATTSSGKVMSAGKLINAREDLTVGLVGTLHWQKWVINHLATDAPSPDDVTDSLLATPVGLSPERTAEFRWLLDNVPETDGEDDNCLAMLASPRGLYLIDGAGVVPLMASTYEGRLTEPAVIAAIGSGADFALGAVLTNLALYVQFDHTYDDAKILENVILNALATVYRFDPSCSGQARMRIFERSEAVRPTARRPARTPVFATDDDDTDEN